MPPLLYRKLALQVHGSQNACDLLKSGAAVKWYVQAAYKYADVVELVDTLVLEASASAWEFESPHPHQSGLFQPGRAAPSNSRCRQFHSASLQASLSFSCRFAFVLAVRHALACAVFRPKCRSRLRCRACFAKKMAKLRQINGFLPEIFAKSAFLCFGRSDSSHILMNEAGWKACLWRNKECRD